MRDRKAEHGYTLVELLVVLMLLGFIGVAIGEGLGFSTRVWERSESRIAVADGDAAAQGVLRLLLASALPRVEDETVRFEGSPSHVAFDAEPPVSFGQSGLVRVELSLSRGSNGTALDVKIASLIDVRRSRQVRLADRLENVRFAYLDASEQVPLWLGFWRDRPRLPAAVRLAADVAGPGASWPLFVARLPIAQDTRCRFDPVSTSCRER
jgi:prepilin-type N-terminal cleavage/methylation domain-containing protein